jgi:hypothetical protein
MSLVPQDMSREAFLASLDEAVDTLLKIRVAVGGLADHEVPRGAIDEALRMDVELWRARLEFDASLTRLRRAAGPDGDEDASDVEAVVDAITVQAADVAYRLGVGRRFPAG